MELHHVSLKSRVAPPLATFTFYTYLYFEPCNKYNLLLEMKRDTGYGYNLDVRVYTVGSYYCRELYNCELPWLN